MTYRFRVLLSAALLIACSSAAFAQTQVRVLNDHSVVWRLSSATPLTTVNAGTELEAIGRDRNWYVVRLPQRQGMPAGEIGRIAVAQVRVIDDRPIPAVSIQQMIARDPLAGDDDPISVFGFAEAGYNRWLAHRSFEAVLGSPATPLVGGGARLLVGDRYGVEFAVERIQKTGQRVFVSDGVAYPLGIRDTIRVIPIYISGLYRQRYGAWTAYGGGGLTRYAYRETSDFSDPDENVNTHFNGFHVLFGMEYGQRRSLLRFAVEGQATNVADAFGTTGAAGSFDEHNLGGFQLRVRILAGR